MIPESVLVVSGRVTARVTLHVGEKMDSGKVRVNAELAAAYTKRLRDLARELKLTGDVTLDRLLRALTGVRGIRETVLFPLTRPE